MASGSSLASRAGDAVCLSGRKWDVPDTLRDVILKHLQELEGQRFGRTEEDFAREDTDEDLAAGTHMYVKILLSYPVYGIFMCCLCSWLNM